MRPVKQVHFVVGPKLKVRQEGLSSDFLTTTPSKTPHGTPPAKSIVLDGEWLRCVSSEGVPFSVPVTNVVSIIFDDEASPEVNQKAPAALLTDTKAPIAKAEAVAPPEAKKTRAKRGSKEAA